MEYWEGSLGLLFSTTSKDGVSLSSGLENSAKKFMATLNLYSYIQTPFISEYKNGVYLAAFKIFLFSLNFSNLTVMCFCVLSLCLQSLGLFIFPKSVSL